jgi:hypothetical protein
VSASAPPYNQGFPFKKEEGTMALTVKRITLWRREASNRPGLLAETLAPLAGSDLKVVMGYRIPGQENRAAIEVAPVAGAKGERNAQAGGLSAAGAIPTLAVQGDNRPGLGAGMAREIAAAGIDISFLVAQVVGDRYSAVFGFGTEDDARRAEAQIRKAASAVAKAARRPAARKKSRRPARKTARRRKR